MWSCSNRAVGVEPKSRIRLSRRRNDRLFYDDGKRPKRRTGATHRSHPDWDRLCLKHFLHHRSNQHRTSDAGKNITFRLKLNSSRALLRCRHVPDDNNTFAPTRECDWNLKMAKYFSTKTTHPNRESYSVGGKLFPHTEFSRSGPSPPGKRFPSFWITAEILVIWKQILFDWKFLPKNFNLCTRVTAFARGWRETSFARIYPLCSDIGMDDWKFAYKKPKLPVNIY